MRKIITNLPLLVIIFAAAAATAVYGQEQQEKQNKSPPSSPTIKRITQDEIKNIIHQALIEGKLIEYKIYKDDRGRFEFDVGTENGTMTILVDQPWGLSSGYIYNETGVYTPDGSQRIVIATTNIASTS